MATELTKPLDAAVLARIRDLDMADAAVPFVVELFLSYFEGLEANLERLEAAAERSDLAVIERIAHTLKGSSANLGAEEAALLCTSIEQGARTGDVAAARVGASALRSAMERLHQRVCELPEFQDSPGPPWQSSAGPV